MQGLFPTDCETFHSQECGARKTRPTTHGQYTTKIIPQSKLPARARPMLPTLLEGLNPFTNGITRSRISDSFNMQFRAEAFFSSPPRAKRSTACIAPASTPQRRLFQLTFPALRILRFLGKTHSFRNLRIGRPVDGSPERASFWERQASPRFRDAFGPALGPMRHGCCCLRGDTWIRNSPMAGLTEVLGCACVLRVL